MYEKGKTEEGKEFHRLGVYIRAVFKFKGYFTIMKKKSILKNKKWSKIKIKKEIQWQYKKKQKIKYMMGNNFLEL